MVKFFFRRYLPGFRVSPQDIPGFNVGSQDDAPGFNVDENGGLQDTTWSYEPPPGSVTPQDPDTTQMPTPVPGVDYPAPPTPPPPPPLPDWPYQLGTMPPLGLPTIFDPRPERPIAINALPGFGSTATSSNYPPPSLSTPPQQAMRNGWLQRPRDVWPNAPAAGALRALAPIRPVANSNLNVGGQTVQQQMPLRQYQQTQRTMAPAPLGTGPAIAYLPEKPGRAELERGPEQELSQFLEAYRQRRGPEGGQSTSDRRSLQPPAQNPSREDNLGMIGPAQGQTLTGERRAAPIKRGPLDAGGMPNGGIIAGVGPARTPRGNLNIHLVGDGDEPSNVRDLERNKRHRIGVEAAVATAVQRGFEIVIREEVATDVPGFDTPRFYDFIMRDPITDKHFGVEVKTTIYETIRLDRAQVEKDAAVIAQGAKVRNRRVWLDGVSYATYCFDCEAFDIRSRVLQGILQDAGVKMTKGYLPGEIPP